MHSLFVVLVGLFIALYMVVNGLLLALWPERFLRFYDFLNRGDYVGRSAPWRRNVGNWEYRLLGVVALVVGIVMIWNLLRVAWPG